MPVTSVSEPPKVNPRQPKVLQTRTVLCDQYHSRRGGSLHCPRIEEGRDIEREQGAYRQLDVALGVDQHIVRLEVAVHNPLWRVRACVRVRVYEAFALWRHRAQRRSPRSRSSGRLTHT